jgi:hypothetical protein
MPTPDLDSGSDSSLDDELNRLCERYGLDAVGKALVQQHGRTAAIAACLGQLQAQAVTCSTSSDGLVPGTPANTTSAVQLTFEIA